jgi:transposase
MRGKNWTKEEIRYLDENWGVFPLETLSRHLGRTKTAIIVKSKRLKLGGDYNSGEYLSARQVSKMLGVDDHTVTDYWVKKCGLKVSFKRMRHRKMHLISYEDLLIWLKNNPDKWDSRRVKHLGLGMEYDWLKEKRLLDSYRPRRRLQKWTQEEISRLKFYFKEGKKIREIAELMERTDNGVEHKLSRIDIWGNSYKKQLVKV